MTITERAAYIKGLAEGLGIDESTKEGKVIKALIDAFDDMALTVSDLEAELDELTEPGRDDRRGPRFSRRGLLRPRRRVRLRRVRRGGL